jgi:hypothetical protein
VAAGARAGDLQTPEPAAAKEGKMIIMTTAAKEIFEAALKLDPADRAHVAHGLLESLDAAPDEDAERLWNEELARRREKIERGQATFHSLDELQKRVEKALGSG